MDWTGSMPLVESFDYSDSFSWRREEMRQSQNTVVDAKEIHLQNCMRTVIKHVIVFPLVLVGFISRSLTF